MFLYENGRGRSYTTPSVPCLRTYKGTYRRKRRSLSATHVRTYKMIEGGIEYSGYIDIKQPPKIKGRKLKSWKKKWVIVNEMSIRSAGRAAAKVDIYADEKTAENSPADKQTFILEFVTDVRPAKSKTRAFAFEIVEKEPVLLLSAATEIETQTWTSTFRKIFFPEKTDSDVFPVAIIANEHTARLALIGQYRMSINPEVIAIISDDQHSYEWSLNMLKRFHLVKDAGNPTVELLTIECGPKSECGEATFQFRSAHVSNILSSIKTNIFLALNRQKTERQNKSDHPAEKAWRSSTVSNTSSGTRARSETCSSTEQRYKDLLETASNSSNKEMTSKNSENSVGTDSANSEEEKGVSPKKRPSVTFDTAVINECTSTGDLLSSPIEITDDDLGSEYNKVEFHLPKASTGVSNIISTFTVAKPGYKTKVLLDEHGYSHVDIVHSKPVLTEDKTRTLSNMSTHSSISGRTASVSSRDSGILYSKIDKSEKFDRGTSSNRSTNSFDSAVSTSSAVDGTETSPINSNATTLTVEIQEVEVTAAELESGIIHSNDDGIYQDVSMDKIKNNSDDNGDSNYSRAKPKLRKCNSTGDFGTDEKENEYEDLDNFRKGKKNLFKHLGMDPTVDPKSVPPSLPERPLSHKIKRKFQNGDKKLFTLPFARNRGKKQKERTASISSSSSDSDSDSTKVNKTNDDIAVKVWPLGNKSVMVANEDLYQPVAIERFLKDNDAISVPQKRERSSSLNLNMSTSMKRPSIEAIDKKNSMWKHNRNVSMQMDMITRPNSTMNADFKNNFDMSLQPDMLSGNRFNFETTGEGERTCDSYDMDSDEEPIYAEVEPMSRDVSGTIENPFPNLTEWKPANMSDVAELNETHYENDESMESVPEAAKGDMLNQGFVEDEINGSEKCDNENVLIDLSVTESGYQGNTTKTAIDIFNMGIGPSLFETSLVPVSLSNVSTVNNSVNFVDIFHLGCGTPLPPSTTDLLDKSYLPSSSMQQDNNTTTQSSENAHAQESIYMDMSTCKNESIYVLPSSLKH